MYELLLFFRLHRRMAEDRSLISDETISALPAGNFHDQTGLGKAAEDAACLLPSLVNNVITTLV